MIEGLESRWLPGDPCDSCGFPNVEYQGQTVNARGDVVGRFECLECGWEVLNE